MSSSHFGFAMITAGCLVLTTTFAAAGVSVRGTSEAAHVEAQQASIEEVLGALRDAYGFTYVSNIPLSDEVNGTYDGPLSRVIALLLPGRDFVLKHEAGGLRLVIISTVGPTIPAVAPRVPAPVPKASSGYRLPTFPPPPPQTSPSVRPNQL